MKKKSKRNKARWHLIVHFFKEFVVRSLMVGMDLVFSPVSTQVFVVVVHSEGNTAAVMLQVEFGVVLVVLVGQIDLVAIDSHILAMGRLDLHHIVVEVLDVEEAMVAMKMMFEAQGAMLSDEVLAMDLEGHFAASRVVFVALRGYIHFVVASVDC